MEQAERFERVSSLYGPGTTGCWLLTTFPVFISWTLNTRSRGKDTFTNDFIATISLPAVAATHLLYEISHSPWPLKELLTSRNEHISQVSAVVEAHLTVCETYIGFALLLAAIPARNGHPRRFVVVLLVGLLSFSTEVLLFVRSADTHISALNFVRPFLFNFASGMVLAFMFLFLAAVVFVVSLLCPTNVPPGRSVEDPIVREYMRERAAIRGMNASGLLSMLFMLPAFLATALSGTSSLGATDYGASIASLTTKTFFFIPQSSSSIADLDQAFALAAGILTLAFSIYAAYNSRLTDGDREFQIWKARREANEKWVKKLKEISEQLKYASQRGDVEFAEDLRSRIIDEMARYDRDGVLSAWPS